MYTHAMFVVMLFTVAKVRSNPSVHQQNEWVDKKEILKLAVTWKKLKAMMLSEIRTNAV